MDTKIKIRELISQLDSNKDNYLFLADAVVTLSTLLFNLGEEMSSARLAEEQALVGHLDVIPTENYKKMAVSEAQSRAITETEGAYDRAKTDYQSITEIIYSLKAKLNIVEKLSRL